MSGMLFETQCRMIFLPVLQTASPFVWTKQHNVTGGQRDRQTDGQNRFGYYSGLHCEQADAM